jgi:hypothetical protein
MDPVKHVEYGQQDYQTLKSATQQQLNSSNAAQYLNIGPQFIVRP